jgi:hypothetical protein
MGSGGVRKPQNWGPGGSETQKGGGPDGGGRYKSCTKFLSRIPKTPVPIGFLGGVRGVFFGGVPKETCPIRKSRKKVKKSEKIGFFPVWGGSGPHFLGFGGGPGSKNDLFFDPCFGGGPWGVIFRGGSQKRRAPFGNPPKQVLKNRCNFTPHF